jgi:hypothetical protein
MKKQPITAKENILRRQVKHSSRMKIWLKETQQVYVGRTFWSTQVLTVKETIDYPLND